MSEGGKCDGRWLRHVLAFIGDTVCLADKPVEPLPGFKPMKAMVYAGVFPMDSNDFTKLEEAIERVSLRL